MQRVDVPHPVLSIDVAHPPRSPDSVELELEEAWARVRNSGAFRLIKIVHGYGSSGKGGSTREVVRNWAYRHRNRFRAVISGEDYSPFDDSTQLLRKVVGAFRDPDLGQSNPGITVVWVK